MSLGRHVGCNVLRTQAADRPGLRVPVVEQHQFRFAAGEAQTLIELRGILGLPLVVAMRRLAVLQPGAQLHGHVQHGCQRPVPLGFPRQTPNSGFQDLQVRENQLLMHHLQVGQGITLHRTPVLIETPHHVQQGVAFPYLCEKPIAEALPPRSTLDQTGDIQDFEAHRYPLLLPGQIAQNRQPVIRNLHQGPVGFDRGKGIGGRLGQRRTGQDVERGALPGIGKPDQANAK